MSHTACDTASSVADRSEQTALICTRNDVRLCNSLRLKAKTIFASYALFDTDALTARICSEQSDLREIKEHILLQFYLVIVSLL